MHFKKIITTALVPLTTFLIFLLLFENRIVLPAWLQVAGRMHPLFLHFPLVLIVLYCIWILFIPKKSIDVTTRQLVADWLLLLSAFTASLTSLMGLFLSKEPGYDPETLWWHKWSGIGLAVITVFWYYFRRNIESIRALVLVLSIIVFAGIIFTGHQGAGITHGQNFLMAPLLPEKNEEIIELEKAVVFTNVIKPILDEKCMSCHNEKKAKGELIMETKDLLLKGGKNGALWDTTQGDLGLMLRRIHLPLEQKKHMPPQGKPQLTDDEINILYHWIKSGADFEKKIIDLPVGDTLRLLAETKINRAEIATYNFEAADDKLIQSLNNVNRVVFPLSIESPALGVNFYNKEFFTSEALKELLKVKDQIVTLDCSHMPLKDEDLKTIGQMPNLRTLLMNYTAVTGKTFSELKKLNNLKSLAVSGTAITKDQLKQLDSFPALQKVHIWNTAIGLDDLDALRKSTSRIKFETGERTDTVVLKLTTPIFENEEMVFTDPLNLKLKHYINGAEIRYTVDGKEPDSINAKIYDKNELLKANTLVKAKAYKQGWISSDVSKKYFLRSTYKPDSIVLVTPPDPKYNAGPKVLADGETGDKSFGNKNSLGYRNNKMEALLYFNHAITASNVTVSILKNAGGYIMPPASVEVWVGNSPSDLKRISTLTPPQPTKMDEAETIPLELHFPATQFQYIKVIATTVSKLPSWHPGRGEKGWVFVDEITVN